MEQEEAFTVLGHALLSYFGVVTVAGTVSLITGLAHCASFGAREFGGFGCQLNEVQPSAAEPDRGLS